MRRIATNGPDRGAMAAIDELGGVHAVAHIFGLSSKVVFNWRRRGLPPYAHQELGKRLKRRKVAFDARLFNQLVAVDGE